MKKTKTKRRVRNPFYMEIQRSGICLINPIRSLPHGKRSPSNPYYQRIMDTGGVCIELGRPRRNEKARPTVVKSVRLPPEVWKRVTRQAAREHIPVHAAVRQAVLLWLQT
jgi:hypothetical protein